MLQLSHLKSLIVLSLFLITTSFSFAQNDSISGVKLIDYYLENNKTIQADSALKLQINYFTSNNQIDSLYQYPYYLGMVELNKNNKKEAAKVAENFITNLSHKTSNARTLYKAYLSLDDLYIDLGDDANSVIASKKALEYANTLEDVTQEVLGKINYAIGGDYYALYDLVNASAYFKQSVVAYERSQTVKKEKLADSYNGVAVSMWTLNKLDSAQFYFNKAISTTKKSNLTAHDRTFYIVAFQFNLALVIDAQGHIGEAIELKKEIIIKLQKIIDGSQDEKLLKKSMRLQASAISNLAAFYHDTGYLTKAYEMMKYAYKKKKEVFDISSPRVATSLIQIASSEIELKEFNKSIETANLALKNLKKASSNYPSVEAEIYYILAKAYSEKNESVQAKVLFEQSEELYKQTYPTEYSQEYLILLRDYALFLSKNNEIEKAVSLSKKSYHYILKNGGENEFPIIKEIINLSKIYYTSGDFINSYKWAEKGNNFLDEKLNQAASLIDSIQIEFNRPTITLLEVQSLYKTKKNKDSVFLKAQIKKINKAVSYLEKRKTTTFSIEDVNSLLSQYKSLSNVSKQLHLELYKLTKEPSYLDKTLAIQESGIYNRIRTQFNIRNNIKFGGVPSALLDREKKLKDLMSNALGTNNSENIKDFFNANEDWDNFLDSLKQNHPKYYNMRYATIEQPLGDIQKSIPENTTVIRFFFIDKILHAFIIDNTDKTIIPLEFELVKNHISQLGEDQSDINKTSTLLFELYQQLWKPLEGKINTKSIIIIPDGELFNLSFETLTSFKISSFNELASNSLLANYYISYNYSLFLLHQENKTIDYSNNFIAFAPEFNEKMKVDYSISITDSINLDKTYLILLPQPFSVDLVNTYSNEFDGSSFINENSTKQIFKQNAKEHKIIHIGTHAESNNITPELSRIIFAKNIPTAKGNEGRVEEDNSLYTFEIYDYNLSSNLTILTACETGKPTYQAGEGMISLAHAFNYAGSESILTSLWEIDEQSSTKIIELFYNNIEIGLTKDEALQKAKLEYISTAQGRTIAPQYWAGLVLIGDAAPIELNSNSTFLYWIVIIVALILFYLFFKRTSKK